MADSNTRFAQLEKFKAECEAPLNQHTYSITPLPLLVSLKRAIVTGGANGYIPCLHARRLITLLQLQEV